jgi:NADPH:quinone reductase
MKAAYIDRLRPPENIQFGELATAVGPSEVLVKTSAVCVDPVDTLIRSGQLLENLTFPFILGRDMAGMVQEVGASVRRFAPGDRVWCNNQGYQGRQGTFAEYVAVREDLLYPLPSAVEEKEAVAFVHSGLTACVGLQEAKLQSGESIFINGGAGNVGSAVLQLARARGARTIFTAGSAEGLAWCREFGADRAVNYRSENVEQALAEFAPEGVNVYWDTSGHPDFDQAVARVARRGRIIVMSGYAARPPFPVGSFYVKRCSMHGFAITYATDAELQTSADEINR